MAADTFTKNNGSDGENIVDKVNNDTSDDVEDKQEESDENKSAPFPNYHIADLRHQLKLQSEDISDDEKKTKADELLSLLKQGDMVNLYQESCVQLGWKCDEQWIKETTQKNIEKEKNLKEKLEDAELNFGPSEVKDTLLQLAHLHCTIGDKNAAVNAYNVAFSKTIGVGGRLDIFLTLIRLGFFHGDLQLVKSNVAKAEEELEKGGDWERRNKLKVYRAILLMTLRDFKGAATLLLGSIATFTATEIISFDKCIFFVVVLSMLALDRSTLKEKVVDSPEVLQVLANDEHLSNFLHTFYSSSYSNFMEQFVNIAKRIKTDRYLGRHYLYFIRNIRLKAYEQFLEPFKSVTVQNMALAFGVSESFMEEEVVSFISSGRLNCKIDKVKGVIESNHADARNSIYFQTLKDGDALLNRIQKLSRVIDM